MPRFGQNVTSGGWFEADTRTDRCPADFQAAIYEAYDILMARNCWQFYPSCLSALRDCISQKWDKLEIDCSKDDDCKWQRGVDPIAAKTDRICGDKITFCDRVFDNSFYRGVSLARLLMHELVHACCGTELDAEVLEQLCFYQQGATAPTSGDLADMVSQSEFGSFNGEVRGHFFIWYNVAGYVACRNDSFETFSPTMLGDPQGRYWGPRDLSNFQFPNVEPIPPGQPSAW